MHEPGLDSGSNNQLYKGHVGMLNMNWLLEEIKFC